MNKRIAKKKKKELYNLVVECKDLIEYWNNEPGYQDACRLLNLADKFVDCKEFAGKVLLHVLCCGTFVYGTYIQFNMPATKDCMELGWKGGYRFLKVPLVVDADDDWKEMEREEWRAVLDRVGF